jgi:hypothetical protein
MWSWEQYSSTILDQYERKSINGHKLKSSSYCLGPILIKFMGPFSLIIFFKFLNEMQTSPFNIFEISKMRRLPWSFQVNKRKKSKERMWCHSIFKYKYSRSKVEMQNCIKTTSFCKTLSENDYVSFFKGVTIWDDVFSIWEWKFTIFFFSYIYIYIHQLKNEK